MQLTVKQPMTVKEYAAEQHIAQQTVYKKISRNADKLKNHVFKMNGKTCLDETAQELLKPNLENAPLVDKVKRLEDEIVRQKAETEKWYKEYQIYSDNSGLLIREADQYKKRIADLEQELTAEKAKTAEKDKQIAEMEKRIAELTEKSLAIADMDKKLNALFAVLEETANTGVGKKIGNLLSGKH